VTNGTYASGGQAVAYWGTNRVMLDKPVTLRSVNGAQFTIIGRKTGDAMRLPCQRRCHHWIHHHQWDGGPWRRVGSDSTGVVSNW